jgi:hypothetical protein
MNVRLAGVSFVVFLSGCVVEAPAPAVVEAAPVELDFDPYQPNPGEQASPIVDPFKVPQNNQPVYVQSAELAQFNANLKAQRDRDAQTQAIVDAVDAAAVRRERLGH